MCTGVCAEPTEPKPWRTPTPTCSLAALELQRAAQDGGPLAVDAARLADELHVPYPLLHCQLLGDAQIMVQLQHGGEADRTPAPPATARAQQHVQLRLLNAVVKFNTWG